MLFNSSIRKELAQTFAAVLTVLMTIIITVMLIRTLSMASKGAVSPQDVMLVLAYVMLGYVPMLLSIALFLTIVFVLARMYRDSEMVIWQSAGAGTWRLLRPILGFTWPILIGITALMLFVWPWSNSQITAIGLQFQQRSEISHIQPGQFQKSSNGKRVAFIESQGNFQENNDYLEGKNAFLFTNDTVNETQTIITAQSVHIETQGEDRFLVFSHGQQLEFDAKTQIRTLLNFKRYSVLAKETQDIISPAQKAKELPTEQLLSNPTARNMGELSWRLGLIFAALNFILLAIPLGYANPRVGRNTSILYAILTCVIYYNLIHLTGNWINNGKFGFFPVMLILHGSMSCIAIFFILKRHYDWKILPNFLSLPSKNKALSTNDKNTKKEKPPLKKTIKRRILLGRMPTVKRLFYAEIFSAVLLVALGFLSLFFFFDFIDDAGNMERKGYSFYFVVLKTFMQLPMHLYELMPIVILIGTIFVLSRMAQHSEFTILRTSGLSPQLALKLLVTVGLFGAMLTFILSDVIIPEANRSSNALMENFFMERGSSSASHSAWLRDRDEEYTYTVNLYQDTNTQLRSISLYAFNKDNQLVQWVKAPTASIQANGTWLLENAVRSTLLHLGTPEAQIQDEPAQNIAWKNNLNADVVSIASSKEAGMNIFSLYQFIQHLSQNAQASDSYLFSFWQKILYPFSCLVMVMLALPFAYLHFRSGGISTKIFGGVMIGITFIVINNMFGHLGQLHHWPPLLSAGMPSLIYLILSFAVFSWLVKNR
ncbi:MAG: LPS export ABC transporter permease LptF [Saezia sp.]